MRTQIHEDFSTSGGASRVDGNPRDGAAAPFDRVRRLDLQLFRWSAIVRRGWRREQPPLPIDQTVGNAFVQITLAQSTFGKTNELQLSSSSIINEGLTPITISLVAGDTGFLPRTTFINSSAPVTFNNAVGSGLSTLQFFADPANVQGANPTNTPGALLESVSGTPLTDPDSFSGSSSTPFDASSPFSMTESARLALRGSGSITGFNQAMESGVPEPSTWALLGAGFGLMALLGLKRRKDRLQTI